MGVAIVDVCLLCISLLCITRSLAGCGAKQREPHPAFLMFSIENHELCERTWEKGLAKYTQMPCGNSKQHQRW